MQPNQMFIKNKAFYRFYNLQKKRSLVTVAHLDLGNLISLAEVVLLWYGLLNLSTVRSMNKKK